MAAAVRTAKSPAIQIAVLATIALVVITTGACTHRGTGTSATNPAAPPTVAVGGGASSDPSAEPSTVAPTYPSGARAYAEAILAAWTGSHNDRLSQLTDPATQGQIVGIPGPIDVHWHYNRCEGAAGSSYCIFFNDPGDMIRLRLSNVSLGDAHAGVEVMFEAVTFPTDPVLYVKKFVGAWQDGNTYRMRILANQAEVDYFTHYTPPGPAVDACYSGGAAGSQYVRVYNGDGLEYLVRVTSATLGKPHAIAGHADPSSSNCL